jgi:hypothetical protein
MTIQLPRTNLQIGTPSPGIGITISKLFLQWIRGLVLDIPERLRATVVQTSAYTARAWDLVLANPTAGGFVITLPVGPEDGAEVGYHNTSSSTNTMTIRAGTNDTVNGGTSVTNKTCAATRDWAVM